VLALPVLIVLDLKRGKKNNITRSTPRLILPNSQQEVSQAPLQLQQNIIQVQFQQQRNILPQLQQQRNGLASVKKGEIAKF
jgi:hypothetical protein